MKLECARIVHHIDGQTGRPRARRHGNADLAGARAKNRNDTAEIGRRADRLPIARSASGSGIKTGDREVAVGGVPAHARSRREHRRNLARTGSPAPTRRIGPALRIEKDREELHPVSPLPASGLTEIIFYLCILQGHKRENYFFYAATKV